MWHLQSKFFSFLTCSLCACRCRWKKAWTKPSNTSAESWSIKPTISISPNPRLHAWKKADPDTTEELCSTRGYWRTFQSGFPAPSKKNVIFFWQSFEKQLLYRTALKSFFSVKCASNIEFTDLALHFGLSVVCLLFKISLDHVHFCSCMFTFCVLIDVTFFLSVSN